MEATKFKKSIEHDSSTTVTSTVFARALADGQLEERKFHGAEFLRCRRLSAIVAVPLSRQPTAGGAGGSNLDVSTSPTFGSTAGGQLMLLAIAAAGGRRLCCFSVLESSTLSLPSMLGADARPHQHVMGALGIDVDKLISGGFFWLSIFTHSSVVRPLSLLASLAEPSAGWLSLRRSCFTRSTGRHPFIRHLLRL